MTRVAKIVMVVAVLFSLLNLAGMVYAGVLGEVAHTTIHAVLALLGGFVAYRVAPRRVSTY